MGCCGGGGHRNMGFSNPKQYGHENEYPARDTQQQQFSTPIELLKERLGKGEITLEEYQQISQVLNA